MNSTRCCEPLCQHPGCWRSAKIEMVEAYRRYALTDVGRSYKSLQPFVDRTISEREQESLPTLKIVNLLENEDELKGDSSHGDLGLSTLSMISPASIRSSKHPIPPCATPLVSSDLHVFKKSYTPQHTGCSIIRGEISSYSQRAPIPMQDFENGKLVAEELCVPCLIWIPSKNKKKKKRKSSSGEAGIQRVHTKNITGNNSDFGFLATPFNKSASPKCFSRATHIVRSPTSKSGPRRLPPISLEATGIVSPSKEFGLSGDGLFGSIRKTPCLGTPQNTQVSIFSGIKHEECHQKCSEEQKQFVKQEYEKGLQNIDNKILVQHEVSAHLEGGNLLVESASNDAKNQQKEERTNKLTKEVRKELALARVTVPKVKLKKLKIEDHCKNSIPSHHLSDIQMQPVYGSESTLSNHSLEVRDGKIDKSDITKEKKDRDYSSEHALSSDDDFVRIKGDGGGSFVPKEELISMWRAESPQSQTVAPLTRTKHDDNDLFGDTEIIEIVKHEQDRAATADLLINDDVGPLRIVSLVASPAPSKSSSDDWPSDKDIMRQTYERYRSFTPFKTQGVSLPNVKLASIEEASREHTFLSTRERGLIPYRALAGPVQELVSRLGPGHFRTSRGAIASARNYPKRTLTHIHPVMRSEFWQKRAKVENISEINVSTMTPRQRKQGSRMTSISQVHTKNPVKSKGYVTEGTGLVANNNNVSSYEIYEVLATSQDLNKDDIGSNPIIIPATSEDGKEVQASCELNENTGVEDRFVHDSEAKDVDFSLIMDTGDKVEKTVCSTDVNERENDFVNLSNADRTGDSTADEFGTTDKAASSPVDDIVTCNHTDSNTEFIAKEVITSCKTDNPVDVEAPRHPEDHLQSDAHENIDYLRDNGESGHTSTCSGIELKRVNHLNASYSISDDSDEESGGEFVMDIEKGLDAFSFTSELNLSLDLEETKKDFAED